MTRRFLLIVGVCFLLLSTVRVSAQTADTNFVQFSGIVLTDDSLQPIPFANISVIGSYRGTMSDLGGFFSFVARRGEHILFSALGYKSVEYTIPDTLVKDRYSLIQLMRRDTLYLDVTFIYPWPTYEQFKSAFVNTDIPDDDLERARKNIEEIEKRVLTEWVPMDGSMNYRNYVDQYRYKLYYAGQMPPNNLLNLAAWVEFFKAWKEGKFKTKRKI